MSATFNVGFTDDKRPNSKVLQPPGGKSSNIFGYDVPPPTVVATPKVSALLPNPVTANSAPAATPIRRGSRNEDTKNRLFGPPDEAVARRATPSRQDTKDRVFGAQTAQLVVTTSISSTPRNKEGRRNPITGEQYEEQSNGNSDVNGKNVTAAVTSNADATTKVNGTTNGDIEIPATGGSDGKLSPANSVSSMASTAPSN